MNQEIHPVQLQASHLRNITLESCFSAPVKVLKKEVQPKLYFSLYNQMLMSRVVRRPTTSTPRPRDEIRQWIKNE